MPRQPSLFGLAVGALLGFATAASAASIGAEYPFQDTGPSTPSNYGHGSMPDSELLQASDGNFYGTTAEGGSGLCPSGVTGQYEGCGTIYRITPKGVQTVLYSFPLDSATNTAPNGAFPTAGLIQGQDGYLYGLARDGGHYCGSGVYGCGTIFRMSLKGVFTLLHQFCSIDGCSVGTGEGANPDNRLVQAPDGTLYGTTAAGGIANSGTVFSATTSGTVTTLHYFQYGAGDGYEPIAALLVGKDGQTLYGTTAFGGANGGGIVFSILGQTLTILHSFDPTGTGIASEPNGALIYGADGLLYGTAYTGVNGGALYSLSTTGGGYSIDATLTLGTTVTGLLLGTDGNMYGTLLSSDPVSGDGGVFVYNPKTKVMIPLVAFDFDTGAAPRGVLIEGSDYALYGTNSLYGGSNSRGTDGGTLFRLMPPLKH